MADTFARMRQLIGTTAEWAANDLVLGLGELAIERLGGGATRMKLGDGVARYSQLPYFDPGVFDFVLKGGDTMTGPLVVPELTVNGAGGFTVSVGPADFLGPVDLGDAATTAEPGAADDNNAKVPTTHWVQTKVAGLITGLAYKGTWDAATNTPPLASGGLGVPTPVRGDFYMVSVAGTTDLDGNDEWLPGDFVAFNGIAWQRVPQPLTHDQIVAGLGYEPAPVDSPTFTGDPKITTDPPLGDDDASIPSTRWVRDQVAADIRAFLPPGTIVDYAGTVAPAGWLLCDGTSKLVASYPALHLAIGYAYGGTGANFNVPDLRGRVTAGLDGAAGRLTMATVVGAVGGAQTHTLTTPEMPAHIHGLTFPGAAGTTPLTATGGQGNYGNTGTGGNPIYYSHPGSTDGVGGNGAHNNVQPTMAVNKIICTGA